MTRGKIILFALATCLVALLLLVVWPPADWAYRLAAPRMPDIQLQSVSGTLWNGSAEQVVVRGLQLGSLRWTIEPRPLLERRLSGHLTLNGDALRIDGHFSLRAGASQLSDLSAEFPAVLLSAVLDVPAVRPSGRIGIEIERMQFEQGMLTAAQGRADWHEMGLTGMSEVRLPGVHMSFAPAPGHAVVGEVRDQGGPLEVIGQWRLAQGRWQSETWLRQREAHPALAEILKWVGQRLPDGRSYLRIEGTLQPVQ